MQWQYIIWHNLAKLEIILQLYCSSVYMTQLYDEPQIIVNTFCTHLVGRGLNSSTSCGLWVAKIGLRSKRCTLFQGLISKDQKLITFSPCGCYGEVRSFFFFVDIYWSDISRFELEIVVDFKVKYFYHLN